jgi:hypothetical protein
MKSSKTAIPASKGVYTLNPTKAVMKVGSGKYIKSTSTNVSGYKKVKKVKGLNK